MKTLCSTALSLLGCIPGLASAAGGTTDERLHVFHHDNVLGTSLDLKVVAAAPAEAERAEAATLAEIDQLARILSTYDATSEISRWLRTCRTPIPVSAELFEVLGLFDEWRIRSDGALDAAAGSVCQLWQAAAAQDRLPAPAAIASAVAAVKQRHWSLDTATRSATHLTDVPLVFNSFAKSYIISRACDAAMAAAQIDAMVLNVGGDLMVRGELTETVRIADPRADAQNDPPVASVRVANRAVATSGNYRRGVQIGGTWFSHIVDPRSGQPVGHVISATVIAPSATDAGALATACCVLQPEQSLRLVAARPDAQCLLLTQDGRRLVSQGWHSLEIPPAADDSRGLLAAGQPTQLIDTASPPPAAPAAALWDEACELVVSFELSRIEGRRNSRPFVAVWIEDADKYPVRTLALWFSGKRWLADLKSWNRGEQLRALAETTDLMPTISSATRPAGKYTLKWDGKDNSGKLVKSGKYTVCLEAVREHGTYQIIRQDLACNGSAAKVEMKGNVEIAAASLDYHHKADGH